MPAYMFEKISPPPARSAVPADPNVVPFPDKAWEEETAEMLKASRLHHLGQRNDISPGACNHPQEDYL